MSSFAPDVVDVVRREAGGVLGDTSGMSREEIVRRLRELMRTSPDEARMVVDDVCVAIDTATGGQYSSELYRLEPMVTAKLGLAS